MTAYDAIIIGTGQAGPPLARRLAGSGMKVAIIERGRFGGTCVNTGCTPTKTLVASAYAAHLARRGADYGFSAGDVKVDMKRVKARKDYVVGLSNHGVERSLKSLENGQVYEGHARFLSPREVQVGTEILNADRIFINVGARAAMPAIPGLDQVDYLTNSSMMNVDFLPDHLLVLGGSYIGLEFGQMYRRFGSGVLLAIIVVSIWTPVADADIARRWFSWPRAALLAPVPILTTAIAYAAWRALSGWGSDAALFIAAVGLFLMSYLGIAISLWPMIIPHHYTLWQAASSPNTQAFLLIGTLVLLPVILMYTGWSYWVFRGKVRSAGER